MMAHWIIERIESVSGDWNKPKRTYCSKCRNSGFAEYRFCPWCGNKMEQDKLEVITTVEKEDK